MPGTDAGKPTSSIPFVLFGEAMLKRTAWATAVTIVIVASVAAARFSSRWGLVYLLSGFWALVFFGLSAMIFKSLLFEKRRLAGLGWVAAKIGWFAVLFALMLYIRTGNDHEIRLAAVAVLAGVVTPLVVAVLKAAGQSMHAPRAHSRSVPDGGRN